MKKEKELIEALMKVIDIAGRQGITIKEVSLMGYWYEIGEASPEELLGIKISQ